MKPLFLGISAAALAIAGAAYAATAPGDAAPAVAPAHGHAHGADRDRVVTRAEAQDQAAKVFARLDVNHDGKLDSSDREAQRAQRQQARFDRLDTNKDGQLSREEFAARPAPGADGARPGMTGHRFGHGRGHGMMGGRKADANGDRSLTQAEFVDAALRRFDRIDANHDGRITPDERQAAHREMRRGRHDRAGTPGAPPPPPPSPQPAN